MSVFAALAGLRPDRSQHRVIGALARKTACADGAWDGVAWPSTVRYVAENKTMPTDASVDEFIAALTNGQRRDDSATVSAMMQAATRHPPVMWGDSIVGFGCEDYQYASGRTGQWPIMAFSPRKNELTLYGLHSSYDGTNPLLGSLGKYRAGVGCLYFRRLTDVDLSILEALMVKAVAYHRLKGRDTLPLIGAPATHALSSVGVTRLSDVLAYTRSELLSLHGFGPKALLILEDALITEQLSLRA
jgi:hypothetical protein